ncbi:acetyl-CoA synthetase [Streptomyces monashensis]|uniref:acetyl-CoA synthetase n=1 Tax=Streptomyces monashensis TaxID=1678012 RepID=UPI0033D504FC
MTPSSSPRGTTTATPSSGCVAGSATVTHSSGDASVESLCVRSGTTVTVVLEPRSQGSWPQPRSSNPMLALVASSVADGKGGLRVTVRAARIGAASVTWGPENAPLFTLRLSVAAYPVQ